MKAVRLPSSLQGPLTYRSAADSADDRRPAWLDINLESLVYNLGVLRARAGSRGIMAVVKADAYGHGAVAVSRVLESAGVEWLAVAFVEEGIELRNSGISIPILVFGGYQESQLPLFRDFNLTATVSNWDHLEMWIHGTSDLPATPQPIHLKVDTARTDGFEHSL